MVRRATLSPLLMIFAGAFGGLPVAAGSDVQPRVSARMILTGGDLDFREPGGKRPVAPRQPRARHAVEAAPTGGSQKANSKTAGSERDWVDEFVTKALGGNPQTPPPRVVRVPRAAPIVLTSPVVPPAIVDAPRPPSAGPAPVTGASPITTGAVTIPPPPPKAPSHAEDREVFLVREAERYQARIDLIKLELARRSYQETRLAGQAALDARPDWRVLERARDAFNETELSAAQAAGFEANAYVNDADKLIVVGIAGTQDLRRDFLAADIWDALIQAQAPQHFFLAKSYIRSIRKRYEAKGYVTECVGHSLGGGACAYAAAELGIRAVVVNPISAGRLPDTARVLITNYIVDGDIARFVYSIRGNDISGDVQLISDSQRDEARRAIQYKYGFLAGPVLVVRDIKDSVKAHQIDRALDLIAAHAGAERTR